ncbi:GL24611 [Drosophila persimilis]|uniref:Protein TsetseEP domain-containing protein n=2 Tax=pseudoobscura subgroup TaxID=32358 RepID=Q2LYR7_DROPS|nr:uncharacterized protein LOC4812900 [Drosophila pseudoobscura]XP_002026245.1 uncharacterized protein LOC6601179 [Drosophila persimilis]EDW33183.1 GL24611 [Drosophila persimilis]
MTAAGAVSLRMLLLCAAALLTVAPAAEAISRPLPPYVGLPTQDGLTHLFLNSRVTRRDPMASVACFGGYIGESNQIAEIYSANYSTCAKEAQNSRKGIDSDFIPTRRTIERSAGRVCEDLRKCNSINGTLDSFNCHATVGSNNTVATYSISGNASESASLLQERYRVVELSHEQCIHKAERRYVESTATNYNYLQACLDGRVKPKPMPVPVPESTTSTSTTTTTTTTTTTEAPTTEPPTEGPPFNVEDQFKQLLNLLN